MTHHEQPKLDHVELASKDPNATRKFLEKAFGWKFNVMPDMMPGGYSMHGREEGAAASGVGIRALQGPEHPGSVSYVTVMNIDEALKNVQAAGGKVVMPKTEIPGMGWTAVYVAPGEVTQGLYQGK